MARVAKKRAKKTDKEQSEKFKALAKKLEADGELNLIEGQKALDDLVRKSAGRITTARPK